jgi:hypothetical protein
MLNTDILLAYELFVSTSVISVANSTISKHPTGWPGSDLLMGIYDSR